VNQVDERARACASVIAVASASADGSEKSVGTRMRLTLRRSIDLKLATSPPVQPRALGRGGLTRPGRCGRKAQCPRCRRPPHPSFICLNAHPLGCAANVEREIAVATKDAPGAGLKHALVIGASTGYGCPAW
jgi:hypothetical protein